MLLIMKKITQITKRTIVIFTLLILGINNSYSQWTQIGQDIDGEAAVDRSGRSVSISADGSIVAIGASANDGNGSDSGHVRVYQNINGTWFQLGQDIDGSAASIFFGDRVSLSSNGLRLAVHAVRNTGANIGAGETKIYDFIGGSWTQIGTGILGAGDGDGSNSKIDLSSDGSRIAIGAIPNNSFAGIVRVFSFNGADWVQTGADFVGNASDQLGKGVSLSANGMRLAIAIAGDDTLGSGLGSARVYEYNGSTWAELGTGIAGEFFNDIPGGVSLSSDGNRIAMGAAGNDGNGLVSGHVRVFQYNGSNWIQIGSDIDGEAVGDQIGNHNTFSLSSNGLIVAIGSTGNDNNTGNSSWNGGHVRIFSFNGIDWVQQGDDIDGEAVQDESGGAVSISANGIVAIGAFNNDGSANLAGHVRVFEFPQTIWTGTPLTFSKADGTDWTQEVNQDRITDNVWLTRADTGGLFNIASATEYMSSMSPVDTEWAFGIIADIETLTFDTWENTNGSDPQGMLNLDMVLHLITDNTYIDIKFTSWTGGLNRMLSGYTYERSTDQSLDIENFENKNEARLYPNPTNDHFTIDSNSTIKAVKILSITGKLIAEYQSQENYNISGLASGLYIVNIETGTGFVTKKLVVD